MSPNDFRDEWKERLRGQPYPLLATRQPDGLHMLSGAALWNRAVECVREWRRAGAAPGDLLIDSPEGIAGATRIMAALIGGFVYFPMPPDEFAAEAATPVERRAAPWIARRDRRRAALRDGVRAGRQAGRQAFRLAPDRSAGLSPVAVPDSVASLEPLPPEARLVLGTSGTSGQGRLIVVLDAASIRHQLICHTEALDLQPGAARLTVLPWWHSFGLVLDLLLGLWARQAIWVQPDLSLRNHSLVDVCRDEGIEHLAVVPRLADVLFAGLRNGPGLPNLCLHTGGARVTEGLRRHARECVGRWVDGYGLTECGPGVLLDGRPVGCDVRIDESTGELLVRSDFLGWFRGRAQRLDESGWLRTRDIAERDAADRISVLGRLDSSWKDASGNWVTVRDIEAWAEEKCAAEVVGVSGDGARGLKLAIALPESAPPAALAWTGSLETVFHRRFGVPVTLRACVLTPAYRELLRSVRAKSTSDALVKSMFPESARWSG